MVLSNKEWLDKMNEIISAIQNGGGDSQVIEDMLSNMWISSVTYNVGDYVLYNNNIWKCLVQNSNITPSEGDTWTRVNITSEISILNSNFDNIFDGMPMMQTLNNCNNILSDACGMYWTDSNTSNKPSDAGFGFIIAVSKGNYATEFYFDINGLYWRRRTSSGWDNWCGITLNT